MRSKTGHNVMLYLLFGCVAFVFWFFLSLDNEIQRDFEIPLSVDNIPDSVVIVNEAPKRINVVVQAKGSQLISFLWGHLPELKLRFTMPSAKQNSVMFSRARLESRVRDYFGQSVQVLAIRPDSIKLSFTTSKGIRVPLKVVSDIKTNLQCVVNGKITCSADSVTIYSNNEIQNIKSINTQRIVLDDLRDTTTVTVGLEKIPGVRVIPDKVTVTIPVEPLISKRKQAQVDVINLPEGVGFITFPSVVDVSYLVPMSHYNNDYPFKVYVDYKSLTPGDHKIKVNISRPPEIYQNVTLSYDSLEYVVEKRN